MGVMDKFLGTMRLNMPEDEFEEDEDEIFEEQPKKSLFAKKSSFDEFDDDEEDEVVEEPARPVRKLVKAPVVKEEAQEKKPRRPIRSTSNRLVNMSGNARSEVCMVIARDDDDANEIADLLLDGKAVVLNLEGINIDSAQRIIDFASGACYTMGGNLQKISKKIFIVTPSSVDLSGDFVENLTDQIELSSLNLNN